MKRVEKIFTTIITGIFIWVLTGCALNSCFFAVENISPKKEIISTNKEKILVSHKSISHLIASENIFDLMLTKTKIKVVGYLWASSNIDLKEKKFRLYSFKDLKGEDIVVNFIHMNKDFINEMIAIKDSEFYNMPFIIEGRFIENQIPTLELMDAQILEPDSFEIVLSK